MSEDRVTAELRVGHAVELASSMVVDENIPGIDTEGPTRITGDRKTDPPADSDYRPVSERDFGRYELIIEMAQGGMATLYLGRIQGPHSFEKLLAIKRIHPHLSRDRDFVNMFQDEARLSARIQHPNVATVFDSGRIDDGYFMAMEYVHGQDLTDLIKAAIRTKAGLGWELAAHIVANAAVGLHAAHELRRSDGTSLNVVHRDVSPHNILISYDGHVKVVDFGIAFAAERSGKTKTGTLKGKVGYMSPEQTNNSPVDRRADIFCLGIVLYETACLKRLFRGSSEVATLLAARVAEIPSPRKANPHLPAGLERIILKALAKRPQDRYATAEEMADDLDALLVSKNKAVKRRHLAECMRELFYDRRKLKDEQIQRALTEPQTEPLKGVGMGPSSDHSLVEPRMVAHASSLRWWHSVLGAVGVVLLLTVILGIALRKADKRISSGVTEASARPVSMKVASAGPAVVSTQGTERSAIRKVTVSVMLRPEVKAATVTFRGQVYQGSRFRTVVVSTNVPEIVQVRAPGYVDDQVEIVPNADSQVIVQLKAATKTNTKIRSKRWRRRKKSTGGFRVIPD